MKRFYLIIKPFLWRMLDIWMIKVIAETGKTTYYWERFDFAFNLCGNFYCYATDFSRKYTLYSTR